MRSRAVAADQEAQRLMDVVRLLPDVLFRCHKGPDGRITWSLNEGGLAEEFHLTTREIQGKSLDELFPGGASDDLRAHFEAAFQGESHVFTNEIDGRHFRHVPRPVCGPDGSIQEVVGFIAEVTELVEAERRLSRLNSDLEAFVHAVSHDLQGPLSAARNLTFLLERRLEGDEEALAGRIQGILDRMGRTVDGLLRLSRAGRTALRRSRVSITDLAHHAVADLEARCPDHKVRIDIQNGLWADADPEMAAIVVENLLGNAWKFTQHEQYPRIRIRASTRHGRPGFVVEDNGVGFPQEHAALLFEPFQRLDTEAPGSGIGLATVHRVLEAHGGSIEARGRPCEGAEFWFGFGEVAKSGDQNGKGRPKRPRRSR